MDNDIASLTFDLHVCKDPSIAAQHGFDLEHAYKDATALKITDMVVVRKGTVQGKPTVDIVLTDKDGKKYVAITTAALLGAIFA